MSQDVKRYEMEYDTLCESDTGDLMHYSDYAALEQQLAAVIKDRNLWQDAHNEDCPNKAMLDTVTEELTAVTAERDALRKSIQEDCGHDGSCDVCGAIPTIQMPYQLCGKCQKRMFDTKAAERARDVAEYTQQNLAMLIRRLSRKVDNKLARQALEYLHRVGLSGSILRSEVPVNGQHDFVNNGRGFCAYPIGLTTCGYRKMEVMHTAVKVIDDNEAASQLSGETKEKSDAEV